MDLKTITTDVPLAVTVSEFEDHLNFEDGHPDSRDFLESFIRAAQLRIERATGRALTHADYLLTLDGLPSSIILPRDPVVSVASVQYLDADWQWQTLASDQYFVSGLGKDSGVAIIPAKDVTWPAVGLANAGVRITFNAGYGADAYDVPSDLKGAVLMLAAHLYENREASIIGMAVNEMPMGVEDAIQTYRTRWF